MTDTRDETWPDRALSPNQERVRQAAELIPVGAHGAAPENFAQLVDAANWMSKARGAVGNHLIGNVGACLAIMEISSKFGFPAYMVARQTYLVGGQIAFMGQLIMAIINRHCPLRSRLKYTFEGEGQELRIIVTGHFKDEADPVSYTSPPLKDIPIKNSPLWKSDPEQQFCYFAARRWQARYWPEGLFGLYTPEDIEAHPELAHNYGADNAIDVTPGLKERLAGVTNGEEGHKDGHVTSELDKIAANAEAPAPKKRRGRPKKETLPAEVAAEPEKPTSEAPTEGSSPSTESSEAPTEAPAAPPAPEPITEPKTAAEYEAYATDWIIKCESVVDGGQRWEGERDLRDNLQVPMAVRKRLQEMLMNKS